MVLVKCNYFKNLEELSTMVLRIVRTVCDGNREELTELRRGCDRLVCETEDALFLDFLPPLERDNIAAMAHGLSRVADTACELHHYIPQRSVLADVNDEARICVKLAEALSQSISKLRKIRRPEELPDIQGYRSLLSEGRIAHKKMISSVRTGAIPRSAAESVIHTGRLRSELSRAFDELVEIMLNNI